MQKKKKRNSVQQKISNGADERDATVNFTL